MSEARLLLWRGFAEGELGFEQDAGERGVELVVKRGCGVGAGLREILGLPGQSRPRESEDAGGAGDGEVYVDNERGGGVLVDQISGGWIGGGESLVDEDKVEVVTAQRGDGGAAAGCGLDISAQVAAESIGDG